LSRPSKAELGINYSEVFHGFHVGIGFDDSVDRAVSSFNELVKSSNFLVGGEVRFNKVESDGDSGVENGSVEQGEGVDNLVGVLFVGD
jgi:hypothetical protein